MFFNKDKFLELAPIAVSRKVSAKDLEAMDGKKVHEFPSESFVLFEVDGEQKAFRNIKADWCDDSKQDSLF